MQLQRSTFQLVRDREISPTLIEGLSLRSNAGLQLAYAFGVIFKLNKCLGREKTNQEAVANN